MILTIITINRNNATGLERTMQSVAAQTRADFEYVVVDGASTDGSKDVIRRNEEAFSSRIHWISELDGGIYAAMNKGIRMASGDYVQFLNSGDYLVDNDTVERMYQALEQNEYPSILYGNMLKEVPGGKPKQDKGFEGKEISFLDFFLGTLNHSPAYIQRELFEKYGLYDESLKIVSDWKWYMKAIVFGQEKPVYTDVDVTLFDMTGISETNKELASQERNQVLGELIPGPVLDDLKKWAPTFRQMRRIERHPWAKKLVWFLERCLFKLEKLR